VADIIEAIFLLIGGTLGYLRRCIGIVLREEKFKHSSTTSRSLPGENKPPETNLHD
jgi:hypothetical protein